MPIVETGNRNVREEAVSFGFSIEENSDRTIITIPRRPSAAVAVANVAIGCLVALCLFFALITWSSESVDFVLIALPLLGILAFLHLICRMDSTLRKKVLQIDRSFLAINDKSYRREHISSIAINGVGVFGSGINFVAASSVAKKSNTIAFDYGDKPVLIAGGLTEQRAGLIVKAIQSALAKWK